MYAGVWLIITYILSPDIWCQEVKMKKPEMQMSSVQLRVGGTKTTKADCQESMAPWTSGLSLSSTALVGTR